MRITEVRVKMVGEDSERLRAFCSVTIDDAFVIRDLKIIDGDDGPFVAMPSRKMSDHCPKCGEKNHLRAKFCNECGTKLSVNRAPRDTSGRVKLYADVAHPINVHSREMIQEAVIKAFNDELALSLEPGYERSDDDYDNFDDDSSGFDELIADLRRPRRERDNLDSDEAAAAHHSDRPEGESGHDDESTASDADERRRPRKQPRTSPESPPPARPRSSKQDENRTRAPTPSETADSDDDDFAAGLDWSSESPRRPSTPVSGDNGQSTAESGSGRRRRGSAAPESTSVPVDDEMPTVSEPGSASSADKPSDEFGAGIL